jgi:hypothetical protein
LYFVHTVTKLSGVFVPFTQGMLQPRSFIATGIARGYHDLAILPNIQEITGLVRTGVCYAELMEATMEVKG